jgi:hypothetical protein
MLVAQGREGVYGDAAREQTQREMAFGRYQIFVMSPQVAAKLKELWLCARREGAAEPWVPRPCRRRSPRRRARRRTIAACST